MCNRAALRGYAGLDNRAGGAVRQQERQRPLRSQQPQSMYAFALKMAPVKAKIWPGLAYLFAVCSTAAVLEQRTDGTTAKAVPYASRNGRAPCARNCQSQFTLARKARARANLQHIIHPRPDYGLRLSHLQYESLFKSFQLLPPRWLAG